MNTDDLRGSSARRDTPGTPSVTPDERWPPIEEDGHCEHGSLEYGPVGLPYAVKGRPYEVHIAEHAEKDWWGVQYGEPYSLPEGLALDGEGSDLDALVIRGTPTASGRFSFTLRAFHDRTSDGCSIMPDPHEFELEVYETEPAPDAGTEGGD